MNDRHVMKQQIHKLKDEIRALGSVNVNAIEDYKELLERHTFLSGQYNDLLEAEKTLEQIIQELDEGMRKQFSEKFGEIQKEFDKAFKELFGGGRGTLELAEDEDILEAGIRIISQPPGKKTPEHDAAFRWGKSSDSHCTSFCDPESEAFTILSSG